MEDLAAAQRRRYFEDIITLFPNSIIRLDKLCETMADALECSGGFVSIATDDMFFGVGGHRVSFRNLNRDRAPSFALDDEVELKSITEADHLRLYIDRHKMPLGYLVCVPLVIRSSSIGSFVLFDMKPKLSGLKLQQWEGLRTASSLATDILLRSTAIKTKLIGLADLIVR